MCCAVESSRSPCRAGRRGKRLLSPSCLIMRLRGNATGDGLLQGCDLYMDAAGSGRLRPLTPSTYLSVELSVEKMRPDQAVSVRLITVTRARETALWGVGGLIRLNPYGDGVS